MQVAFLALDRLIGNCNICAEQKILGHEQDEMVQNLVKTESFS